MYGSETDFINIFINLLFNFINLLIFDMLDLTIERRWFWLPNLNLLYLLNCFTFYHWAGVSLVSFFCKIQII